MAHGIRILSHERGNPETGVCRSLTVLALLDSTGETQNFGFRLLSPVSSPDQSSPLQTRIHTVSWRRFPASS